MLPIDPGLHRFARSLALRRAERFASVDFVETRDPAAVVATAHAGAGTSRSARAAPTCRRALLGAPLNGSAVAHERMRKPVALAISHRTPRPATPTGVVITTIPLHLAT